MQSVKKDLIRCVARTCPARLLHRIFHDSVENYFDDKMVSVRGHSVLPTRPNRPSRCPVPVDRPVTRNSGPAASVHHPGLSCKLHPAEPLSGNSPDGQGRQSRRGWQDERTGYDQHLEREASRPGSL
jgi:hypothetical protein